MNVEALALAGLASLESIVAVLTSGIAAELGYGLSTVALKLTLNGPSPAAILPTFQVTVRVALVYVPPVPAETNVSPVGSTSLMVVPVILIGESFAYVI